MNNIQQTYIDTSIAATRADLDKQQFDRLVAEKGRQVLLEKAILCPCKGRSTNAKSTCKNCGGTGYAFVNPTPTRMVLTGMDVATKMMPWSEEARGMTAVTAMAEEELSYMDRITVLDAESVYNEVITIDISESSIRFAHTAYRIKQLQFAGVFRGDGVPYLQLQSNQYDIVNGIFKLTDDTIQSDENGDVVITLRYKHAPAFHIIEFKRETMQSFKLNDKVEELQNFPISAYARRAHYQMTAQNLAGDRLLTNSYAIDGYSITYNRVIFTSEDGQNSFTLEI